MDGGRDEVTSAQPTTIFSRSFKVKASMFSRISTSCLERDLVMLVSVLTCSLRGNITVFHQIYLFYDIKPLKNIHRHKPPITHLSSLQVFSVLKNGMVSGLSISAFFLRMFICSLVYLPTQETDWIQVHEEDLYRSTGPHLSRNFSSSWKQTSWISAESFGLIFPVSLGTALMHWWDKRHDYTGNKKAPTTLQEGWSNELCFSFLGTWIMST